MMCHKINDSKRREMEKEVSSVSSWTKYRIASQVLHSPGPDISVGRGNKTDYTSFHTVTLVLIMLHTTGTAIYVYKWYSHV